MVTKVELERSEKVTLERLNQEYVDAFMNSDVDWYRVHLAEDFVCIDSDGAILSKDQFLLNTEKGPDVTHYILDKVDVRIYGDDAALVRATGVWTRGDGSSGMSRYIDVYVKESGGWKAVSAQITRTSLLEQGGI
jgi:hypothetical protein